VLGTHLAWRYGGVAEVAGGGPRLGRLGHRCSSALEEGEGEGEQRRSWRPNNPPPPLMRKFSEPLNPPRETASGRDAGARWPRTPGWAASYVCGGTTLWGSTAGHTAER
jgi:hypothetical protein